ncbi:hypothetical protein O0I10_010450 [Lichtheimia ornata]|uniref:Uncharacterized protein n=1 Tax=Lichtheimia ornata TaxID=688661 RepID=A0AAD7UUM6_9FUNG|nr:uncharacterized protein O0I10_010450 [Lichtheimia ornata]KAJ8653883.1 hypothetical protein O0I10_010450 [Lichtheimia ornata]
MRPQGFKNASAVHTASIQVRLLISLPTERRWISLMMPISGSNESMMNMLDDGTSGSNRIRISKQECCMVGSMVCMVLDLQSKIR